MTHQLVSIIISLQSIHCIEIRILINLILLFIGLYFLGTSLLPLLCMGQKKARNWDRGVFSV